jgi:hypothetical protein
LLGVFCKKNESYILTNSKVIAILSMVFYLLFVIVDFNYGVFGSQGPKFYPFFTDEYSFNNVNLNQIQKMFGSIFFLSLFFFIESNYKVDIRFLDVCAKYSFGVFFIHMYWVVILNKIIGDVSYSYFLISFIGFTCSIVSLYFFKRITEKFKFNSRIFVGC